MDYFFPGQCYETVVTDRAADAKCLVMALGRALSLFVMLAAIVGVSSLLVVDPFTSYYVHLNTILVKLPQIIKMINARSAENISYLATIQELAAITFTITYNFAKSFPFSVWGENVFMAIQVLIVLILMFYYNHNLVYLAVFAPVYSVAVLYLTSRYASLVLLSTLQGSVIPLAISSMLMQIFTTYSNKTTGQLSIITYSLSWFFMIIRIFTNLLETADTLMMIILVSLFVGNSIVLFQFYLYNDSPKTKKTQLSSRLSPKLQ